MRHCIKVEIGRFPTAWSSLKEAKGPRQPIRCNTIAMRHQNRHLGAIHGGLLTIRGAVTGFARPSLERSTQGLHGWDPLNKLLHRAGIQL